jgi:hypothetical protein
MFIAPGIFNLYFIRREATLSLRGGKRFCSVGSIIYFAPTERLPSWQFSEFRLDGRLVRRETSRTSPASKTSQLRR